MTSSAQATARWEPVLSGEVAERARESVERVVRVLERDPEAHGSGFSLAAGTAGLAVAIGYLSRVLERPALMDGALGFLDRAVGGLASSTSGPGLYSGFTGVAWAAAHLQAVGLLEPDDVDIYEEIDAALLKLLEDSHRPRTYDLISGLVGTGVYALERWPHPRAERILEVVVGRIAAMREARAAGVTWKTAAELLHADQHRQAPHGYYNLGLAHGVPGILGFLARARGAGALNPEGERILEAGIDWLLEQKRDLGHGLRFTYWLPAGTAQRVKGSRVAWCYGDLGVAAALLVAGASCGRPDWSRQAVAVARDCVAVDPRHTGVKDHGLCHGAAGLGHLFNRMAQISGDRTLRTAARVWLEKTLEMRVPGTGIDGYAFWTARDRQAEKPASADFGFARETGFLNGAAGVALALAAGFSHVDPEWDRVLLISSGFPNGRKPAPAASPPERGARS